MLSGCCCPPASGVVEGMDADLARPARQILREGLADEFQLRDRIRNELDDLSSNRSVADNDPCV